ncbi:MAG: hypothetical protein JSU92_11700 [Deltaproteobacteria bacterium]|nr:MAG: hypothetical protein JSU92_11700 [Deltaproteobacteria bacterium]
MYEKIVTHGDFDGIISAAICSYALKVDKVMFAGPSTITRSLISISDRDIVCDLPYPLECGLWFDHHEGNVLDLEYRGINSEEIPGCFSLKDSCARVVYHYFAESCELPSRFLEAVEEADRIDSFNYQSIEEWREETPGKIIDFSIKSQQGPSREKDKYLRQLVEWIRDEALTRVATFPPVIDGFQVYKANETKMLKTIKECSYFIPEDSRQEIVVIDLTKYRHRTGLTKHLAFILNTQALAVLEVKSMFDMGVKTNDLSLSMALSLNLTREEHHKDIGEIMRRLNIGDGHKGAAAGTVGCQTKAEMLKEKERILNKIFRLWAEQG